MANMGLEKKTMRSDYLFYALGAVFFLITAASIVLVIDQTEKSLWVVSTVVVGLFSATLGYHFRPKTPTATLQSVDAPSVKPAAQTAETAPIQAEKAEAGPIAVATPVSLVTVAKQELATSAPTLPAVEAQAAPKQSELLTVHGINAARAAQLNALGVNSLDDLAKASADDLAKALVVSPRITRMWIGSAKKQKKNEN
jgi:predicted flap endonuclease-1-like 5' DNA nuclease